MAHPFSFYRRRILLDAIRIFAVPYFLLYAVLYVTRSRIGISVIPVYILFIAISAYTRSFYSTVIHAREARRFGARLAPEVIGRWPGNIDILLRMLKSGRTSYYAEFYESLFDEYQSTTLNLRLLWSDMIITKDEAHSKFVLSTGFNHFWRGVYQKERMELFLGSGIFNRDDEEWKLHRAIARPFFARDRISDFKIFDRYAAKTLAIISDLASSNQPVEVQDLYARFTLDAASEFLFGQNMDTLSGILPVAGRAIMSAKGSATTDEFGSFVQAFETTQTVVSERARRGYFWPVAELLHDNVAPHMDVINSWLNPVIERVLGHKMRMKKAGVQVTADQNTFLEYLADIMEDPKLIRDQLLNILLASRDTTASLLTFVTYIMAMHPDIAKRLRAEVLQYCGPDGAPTFEIIKKMRYMRAVINETLRLFPPVPMNIRESRPEPCVFPPSDGTYLEPPEPIYMPASTRIMYHPLLTHRNPALWGDDAEVFDPDRWLDDRLSRFTSNPMMYTPFSAGPRICLGQNYALNEASYFLSRLLQQFDTFNLALDAQPPASLPPTEWQDGKGRKTIEKIWPAAALTLYSKGGLWARFGKLTPQ